MLLFPSRALLTMALALMVSVPALAKTFAVPDDFATIQGAIDAAPRSGVQISVAPGRYVENLSINGKSIKLVSKGGAGLTVIDGGRRTAVIAIMGTGKEQVSIIGFKLTNGYNSLWTDFGSGGAVRVELAKAVIEDNLIEGNIACMGAGIFSQDATLEVRRNVIRANPQENCGGANGGGIFMNGSDKGSSVITENLIVGHRIGGYGGGVAINAVKDVKIDRNVIKDNQSAGYGGGLFIDNSSVDLGRNVIEGNVAIGDESSGGGVTIIASDKSNRVDVSENLMRGNLADYGSAALLLAYYDHGVQFKKNVVTGSTAGPLVRCEALPVKIPMSNVLTNTGGPEVSGSCLR